MWIAEANFRMDCYIYNSNTEGIYLIMKTCVRNRYCKIGICILLIVISLGIIIKFNILFLEKLQTADNLQKQNEQLQSDYSDMSIQVERSIEYNKELNEKLEKYLEVNSQIIDEIGEWKSESESVWQAFHGDWRIYYFYTANISGQQENTECSHIAFRQKYIYMTDDHITDEPIYTAVLCNREKILTELSDMGIADKEIIDMLDRDYYVEMNFSNTFRWNRTAFPGEIDFIENAKYYPINKRIMLCFSRNAGGKVYVFSRFIWGE